MANSGVNAGFAKCFIFFIAVVILVQGCGYLGLSIWGITLRQCSKEIFDVNKEPFQFVTNLIYFINEDCPNPSIIVPNTPGTTNLEINYSSTQTVESRAFIFMITYAAISALWIVTSLTIITTLCRPITKTVNVLCFWPWFLVIIAGCILDIVATGYYVYDLIHTTSAAKTLEYLSITTSEKALKFLSNFDAYFITPAVIMTCISSRFVVIWLLNIVGSSFCLSLSNTLSKRNSSKQNSVNSAATTSTAPVSDHQHDIHQEIQPVQIQLRQSRQQHKQQRQEEQQRPMLSPPQESELIRPKPLQVQNVTSVQRRSSFPPQTNQNIRPHNAQPPAVTNDIPANSDMITYRTTETHPDKLNYPSQQLTFQYQQELSTISPLNSRYSSTNEHFQYPMQNQRVSDELRGQLPWSYTNLPQPVPKK